ncbi:hypothetical protein MLD38_002554 [Melastoma candidum]|uniref:Uncharacterized protein n=1 Tax=Melastoma candidum TaxID=119954 RepID=A0ACB9RZQ8_9MYRT|nr:hypothetical protein MLD38_002554 [Melastoma candidum]
MATRGKVRRHGQDLNCDEVKSYRPALLIITAVTLFGAFVSVLLAVRTREFYGGDIYKKFREEAKEADTEMTLSSAVNNNNNNVVHVETKGR